MNASEVCAVLHSLMERQRETTFNADGGDDRIYLTQREWEAIAEALQIIEGEF